ncbi:MAG TPA: gliding motility-associated C-terminal domain-containing protein [Bacteroidia bacterium]
MKRIHFLLPLICSFCSFSYSQSVQPLVINSFGGNGTVPSPGGNTEVYYSIGEPFYTDEMSSTYNYRVTQGFLQPGFVYGGLSITPLVNGMSCINSKDASIKLDITAVNFPLTVKWFKNGILLTDTTPRLFNLEAGVYKYTVTDSHGNTKSETMQITNSNEVCEVIIHNGVSPNNDDQNDFLLIERIQNHPGNSVSIFNRWGNELWQGRNYDNDQVKWYGQDSKNEKLPSGTYFFVVELEEKKLTGWVELAY